MIDKNLKKRTISSISDLPALPEITSRLLEMINNPETSAADVSKLISNDVGITSKVLRMANSAFYGIPRTITTVQNAVVLLGMKVVNSLVFSISVGNMFPVGDKKTGLNRKAFWKHSIACAVCAKMLSQKAKRFGMFDPEESFCAGLLHDIGRLVLDQFYGEELLKTIEEAAKSQKLLHETELEMLGYRHTDVANWLISKWELPQNLRMPIVSHHFPASVDTAIEITYLIHLSDVVAHESGFSLYQNEKHPILFPEAVEILGISEKQIVRTREALPGEVEKLESSFMFS